jgi:hypothetical protein
MSDLASGNGHRDLPLPPRGTGRRRSLIILGLLVVGLPLAFFLRSAVDEGWRVVTTVAALEDRDVIYVANAHVFLVAADPSIALREASPHLGEPLSYCADGQNFVSLAYGSLFDREGRYIDGPAPRGMDRVGIRTQDGVVQINLQEKIPGPPREQRGTVMGPLCIPEKVSLLRPGFVEPHPDA